MTTPDQPYLYGDGLDDEAFLASLENNTKEEPPLSMSMFASKEDYDEAMNCELRNNQLKR